MARNIGNLNFSGNFEIKGTAPIDARTLVPTVLELTEQSTWIDSDNKIWLYDGLVVSVQENHGLYMLKGYDPVNNPTAYADTSNWVRLDAAAAKIDLITDVETNDDTKALAASLGKVLNDKIENLKSSLSSIYIYKGSVTSYSDLPNNASVGDTYNVENANGEIPAGTNYAWTGSSWDALGGSVDLSGYYTKSEVDSLLEETSGDISEQLETISASVSLNTSDLLVLKGDATTSGSLANTLTLALEYTDTQLTGYVQKEEGYTLISKEKLTLIDTNASEIEDLSSLIEANTAGLQILNGDADTEGSVLNIVNTQINSAFEWQIIE